MSEPMTSGEIEDVLSSIRKLVSEDLRPQVRPAAPVVPREVGPSEVGPRESDKLILTPALRVVEGSTEAEATLAAKPAAEPEPEPQTRLRLETVVSTFAAHVSPPAEGWEPETGDASVTRLVRTPPVLLSEPEATRVVEAFPDASAADDSGDVEDAVLAGSSARLHFAWQAQPDETSAEDGDDILTGERDNALAGADDAPEAPVLDIDSDALADLVRDILRDELHGAMGERMTRNIRKLVRAEVARILATRDLA